jgi:5'-methylthioinosine phosphorylase
MSALGIIGGTGLAVFDGLQIERLETANTPWGAPSAPLVRGWLEGRPVVFLARHGAHHGIAPHLVNYRANLWSLREAGARRVIAVNAVGGIGDEYPPGRLVVPHQLIDYTWGRAHSYSDGAGGELQHVDFTHPYSDALRDALLAAAARAGLPAADGAVYGVTQGPRLETAAEIDRLARDGCDIVGMTGMPEAGLAREIALEYACCAVVVNRAAGRGEDIHGELDRWVGEGMAAARKVILAMIAELSPS